MTTDRDLERILDLWLADGPSEAPDRVIDVVAERIDRQRQRPAWRLARRPTTMTTFRLAGLAAAVIVVAIVGYTMFAKPTAQIGGPSPSPSATLAPTATLSPTASPSPGRTPAPTAFVCSDGTTACGGDLTAGAHSSTTFRPAISFTVPAGWQNTFDIARTYTLRPPGGTFTVQIFSQNAIPDQNDTCTPAKKAGAGDTVAEWVTYLTKHPGLTASAPQSVAVGGYVGRSVQFRVAPAWTKSCPNSIGSAVVVLTDSGAPPTRVKWVDDQVSTFVILDVRGRTVIVDVESAPSVDRNAIDMETMKPILDSIRFTP